MHHCKRAAIHHELLVHGFDSGERLRYMLMHVSSYIIELNPFDIGFPGSTNI